MKRKAVMVSIAISFLILGLYAFRAVAMHHYVAPYLLIAPSIGILCGRIYLSRNGKLER